MALSLLVSASLHLGVDIWYGILIHVTHPWHMGQEVLYMKNSHQLGLSFVPFQHNNLKVGQLHALILPLMIEKSILLAFSNYLI